MRFVLLLAVLHRGHQRVLYAGLCLETGYNNLVQRVFRYDAVDKYWAVVAALGLPGRPQALNGLAVRLQAPTGGEEAADIGAVLQ